MSPASPATDHTTSVNKGKLDQLQFPEESDTVDRNGQRWNAASASGEKGAKMKTIGRTIGYLIAQTIVAFVPD